MHNMPHTEEAKKKMSAARKGKPNMARRRESRFENGVELYRCGRCGEFKPYCDFYKNKRTILGITSECRKCHCEVSIKTRNTENARKINREYMRRRRAKSPDIVRAEEREKSRKRPQNEKTRARQLVNNAVKRGAIQRPECCQSCGASGKVYAHHEDYSKPLEVIWLCSECHGMRHRKIAGERKEKT